MLGKRPRGSPCARWQFAMPPRDVARGGHQGLRPRRGCAVSPGSFSSLLFSAEIGFTDNSVRSLCWLQNGFADAFPVDQNWPRPSPHLCCRRSEEHTSELQSLMRISYAVFCLKKKKKKTNNYTETNSTRKLMKIIPHNN